MENKMHSLQMLLTDSKLHSGRLCSCHFCPGAGASDNELVSSQAHLSDCDHFSNDDGTFCTWFCSTTCIKCPFFFFFFFYNENATCYAVKSNHH